MQAELLRLIEERIMRKENTEVLDEDGRYRNLGRFDRGFAIEAARFPNSGGCKLPGGGKRLNLWNTNV
jgi:hypothetical protein